MNFAVGDNIRYKDTPDQTGIVMRLHPLAATVGIIVMMNEGPMFTKGNVRAYFDSALDQLEKYVLN